MPLVASYIISYNSYGTYLIQAQTMPRGRKRKNLKPASLPAGKALPSIVLLLVKFFLIQIGKIPLLLIKKLITICTTIVGHLSTLHFPILRLRRRKGRPRTTPFIPFYLKKIRAFLKIYFPKKLRIATSFAAAITLVYIYSTTIFSLGAELPSPKRLTTPIQPLTTEFYDRNGILLYRIYEGRNRSLIKLGEVPKYLIEATLAAEDKNFYNHPGVDFMAVARALWANFRYGRMEGASTITQQLIKNTLLTPEKTYARKIKEVILALWAERLYSKEDILQMYLNEAPYGGPAWGVEAASQTYFGRHVSELTLAQSAFLAGLPASPTQFSPYGPNPQSAKIRQRWVLDRMVLEGYIKKAQAEGAYSEDLHIKPTVNNIRAPHFVMYVKGLLSQKYSPRVVSQGGLKVITTLDIKMQEEVEKIVSGEVAKLGALNVTNGAAMVTDAKTGQILAMVGSKDYHNPIFGSFNVTEALRQPGSSIKPLTYAAAFELGYSPGNTILDSPAVFKNQWGPSYRPVNYDGKFHGPVSIRVALGSSYNIPAVKMLATIGIPAFLQKAGDLGITTFDEPEKYGLSLTLGSAEVKMVDMMKMYGAFSQGGKRTESNPILKVTDANGNILEEYEYKSEQAIDPEAAYLINHVLSDNSARTSAFGSNSLLKITGHTVAAKTGTSDSKRDNWTFGYTPEFVAGVWVGNNDNSPMHPSLASGITGAAPIWNKIMTLLLQDKPDIAFGKPEGIAVATVDGRKDLVMEGVKLQGLVKFAKKDGQNIFSDAFSSYATSSAQQAAVKTDTN